MSNWKHNIKGVNWSEYKLYDREQIFQDVVKDAGGDFEQPPYSIVWEDPTDIDAPVRVTTPSPIWWAMALHGGILPPVEVYWALAADEAQPDFVRHTRGHLLHETPPMRPMTEEEAMEYLIMKDIPQSVWKDYKGNRQILKIVTREQIPSNREHRNAWKIKQEQKDAA